MRRRNEYQDVRVDIFDDEIAYVFDGTLPFICFGAERDVIVHGLLVSHGEQRLILDYLKQVTMISAVKPLLEDESSSLPVDITAAQTGSQRTMAWMLDINKGGLCSHYSKP